VCIRVGDLVTDSGVETPISGLAGIRIHPCRHSHSPRWITLNDNVSSTVTGGCFVVRHCNLSHRI